MTTNLLVLSNAYTKYKLELASKNRSYPSYTGLIKTAYTRGITIEDWNTLNMYTRMVMSDTVATSEYVQALTAHVKDIDDALAEMTPHEQLINELKAYTDAKVSQHYTQVASSPALGNTAPATIYTGVWLDTSGDTPVETQEVIVPEVVSEELLTFSSEEPEETDSYTPFVIDDEALTFEASDEELSFGDN